MRIGLVDVDGKRFPNLALKDRNMEQSEIWKDIVGFEGMYQVSNKGRVKSIDRTLTYKNGRIHHYPEHVLHQQKDTRRGKDYMIVCLTDGKKKYSRQVHRLVAEAFIPNPDKLPQVNHKDENESNNTASNLEWCDVRYNLNYGTRNRRASISRGKTTLQYSLSGEFLNEHTGAREAARQLGLNPYCGANIQNCCNGKRKTAYGYIWKWKYSTKYIDR